MLHYQSSILLIWRSNKILEIFRVVNRVSRDFMNYFWNKDLGVTHHHHLNKSLAIQITHFQIFRFKKNFVEQLHFSDFTFLFWKNFLFEILKNFCHWRKSGRILAQSSKTIFQISKLISRFHFQIKAISPQKF